MSVRCDGPAADLRLVPVAVDISRVAGCEEGGIARPPDGAGKRVEGVCLWPGLKKRAIDAAVAVGFKILFKRLTSKGNTDCPRSDSCRCNGQYEYECSFDQWNH